MAGRGLQRKEGLPVTGRAGGDLRPVRVGVVPERVRVSAKQEAARHLCGPHAGVIRRSGARRHGHGRPHRTRDCPVAGLGCVTVRDHVRTPIGTQVRNRELGIGYVRLVDLPEG